MKYTTQTQHKNLPKQVLYAVLLGIFVGVFFGDYCRYLFPIGQIYVMLLRAFVYPYIISTLLSSLGQLAPSLSKRIFKRGWVFYVSLILTTYAILIILGLSIPSAALNITSAGQAQNMPIDILDLIIPANIFEALAKNYVPAVVIFLVLFGLMLQHVAQKQYIFSILDTISNTCLAFWNVLITLSPLGVFALIGSTAGTIRLSQLSSLGIFFSLFLIAIVILTFWLIPALISALTPITYKDLFKHLREALFISAATTLSVVALPYIREITHQLIGKPREMDKESDEVINTSLLISYPFAQLGNFFTYLFILFAALYFNRQLGFAHLLQLPIATFLSGIGVPSTAINAVSLLPDWLKLPNDTTTLFVSINAIMRYGQALIAVMAFSFVTITTTYAYYNKLQVNIKKIVTHLGLALLVVSAITFALTKLFPDPNTQLARRFANFSVNPLLEHQVSTRILTAFDGSNVSPAPIKEDTLYRIQRTGVLRVGFNADMKPFMYYNKHDELAGFDAAYAYSLAASLHAKLQFIPFTWPNLVKDIQANRFDIAMSAIYVSESRLADVSFSDTYFKSPIAIIVPAEQKSRYKSTADIQKTQGLRIGTFDDPILVNIIKTNFPNAKIVFLSGQSDSLHVAFASQKIDIALWSEVQCTAFTITYPQYETITPKNIAAPVLMAYMMNKSSSQFIRYVNYWLSINKNNNFYERTYKHWILLRPLRDNQPRWSIWSNVLGFKDANSRR